MTGRKGVDQVEQIMKFAEVCKMYQDKIDKLTDKVEKIQAYCRLLQEGDPENENPKKILDEIDRITERNN